MQLLGISGSLRSQSSNSALLEALGLLLPADMKLVLFKGIARLPAFNPDLEADQKFDSVEDFRNAICESTAVLISTPEYAHGIPGALKNALDWVVGSGEFSEKPVILVNASSRAVYAQAALKEVLFAINARLLPEAEITIDIPKGLLVPEVISQDPLVAAAIGSSILAISRRIQQDRILSLEKA